MGALYASTIRRPLQQTPHAGWAPLVCVSVVRHRILPIEKKKFSGGFYLFFSSVQISLIFFLILVVVLVVVVVVVVVVVAGMEWLVVVVAVVPPFGEYLAYRFDILVTAKYDARVCLGWTLLGCLLSSIIYYRLANL